MGKGAEIRNAICSVVRNQSSHNQRMEKKVEGSTKIKSNY